MFNVVGRLRLFLRSGATFSHVMILSMAVLRILAMLFLFLIGFYISLIATSRPLTNEERDSVERAIAILEQKGLKDDARMLRYAVYRGPDNWLNSFSEGAFAKTNFPFQIITIYPDFITVPIDDNERAAVLLHEARHLRGSTEAEAYKYVWLNHCSLDLHRSPGYSNSRVFTGENEAKIRNPDLPQVSCD